MILLLPPVLPAAKDAPLGPGGVIETSDGICLHYLDEGKGGAALVFIPGWIMPAAIWERQIRYFSRCYRTVALDPRSQGESEVAPRGHEPKRRSQDIAELMATLQLQKPVLVGWSLGAIEVLAYLKQYGTDNLSGVVLVDNEIGGFPSPEKSAKRERFLKDIQQAREEATGRFVRNMYKKGQGGLYYKKLTEQALKTPTDIAIKLLENIYPGETWRPEFRKIKVPLLFVITPRLKDQADYLKDKMPDAWVAVFEDAGHALFVDEDERFNRLLDDFLFVAKFKPCPRHDQGE
jgi:microsomal epoxide hydrolase